LKWIDKRTNNSYSTTFLKEGGPWSKFVDFELGVNSVKKLSDSKRWGDLAGGEERFGSMMSYYAQYFEVN
jgi:hypothetical protein